MGTRNCDIRVLLTFTHLSPQQLHHNPRRGHALSHSTFHSDHRAHRIATVRRHYPPAAMTAASISACSECLLPRRPLGHHAPPRRSAHAKPFPRPAFIPSPPASLLSNPRAVCRPPRADRAAAPRAQSSSHDDLEGRQQRDTCLSRRDALLSLALLPPSLSAAALLSPSPSLAASPAAPDTTVTHRAFLDFAVCPTAVRLDRTLGDDALICADGEPLGRVVLGLYGRAAPDTVAQFVRMVAGDAGSTYKGSVIHRSLPGQYVQAGHQGQVARGDVAPPTLLPPNRDTVAAASFALSHLRPGTLSLCVGENNDDERARARSNYRNVEFLITTGGTEGEGGRGRDKGETGRGEWGGQQVVVCSLGLVVHVTACSPIIRPLLTALFVPFIRRPFPPSTAASFRHRPPLSPARPILSTLLRGLPVTCYSPTASSDFLFLPPSPFPPLPPPGPGPATQLDGDNIVFGTVLEGMEVVAAVAAVPTFQPSDRIRQFNDFAALLGDDRAAKGRGTWNRPLKAIVIQDCGLLE
ncbi:unnamed protein product [Closterium sp. NIES-65]|nr:unnamed protein product [Closterium sp. NIES-65]